MIRRSYLFHPNDTEVLSAIARTDFDGNDSEVIRQALRHFVATQYPVLAERFQIAERDRYGTPKPADR